MCVRTNMEEFLNLPIGTIIIARRYKTEEERKKMKFEHEIGPYIIIGSYGMQKIALYCTSKDLGSKPALNYYDFYIIDKTNSPLSKTTYIDMKDCSLISCNEYIQVIGYLSQTEIKEIYKRLEYQKTFKNINYYDTKIKYMPVAPGDILYIDKQGYLVYDKNNESLFLFHFNLTTKECSYRQNHTIPSINSTNKRIGAISQEELRIILNEYKKQLTNSKSSTTSKENNVSSKINCLIKYQDKLYYVYFCLPGKLLAFEVLEENEIDKLKYSNKYIQTHINEVPYWILLDHKKDIPHDTKFHFIAYANEEESAYIRDIRLNMSVGK